MNLKDSMKRLQKREHITQDEIFRRLDCTRSAMEKNSTEIQAAFQLAFGTDSTFNSSKRSQKSGESKELERFLPWARKFPIRALQKQGFIPTNIKDADLVRAIFRFMNVGSIGGFNNYYDATLHSPNPQTYAAWIRLGELCIKRSATEFTPNQETVLSNLKFLRKNIFFHGQSLRHIAHEALHNCGIEVIEIEPFLTAPIPTCAFYWRGYQPIIQFPTTKMNDSKFLEALFHAVAHMLYHPLRTSCLQIGTCAKHVLPQHSLVEPSHNTAAPSILETEAEQFAQDNLLSEAEECELICCGHFSERRCIQHFSGLFHVRPGILVERLQQQGKVNRRTPLNDFKIAV